MKASTKPALDKRISELEKRWLLDEGPPLVIIVEDPEGNTEYHYLRKSKEELRNESIKL